MQPQMPGEVEDLPGQGGHRRRERAAPVERLAVVDPLGPDVDLLGAVPEGLADVADGRPGPVGDDVRHLGGVVPAVVLEDVGDDLLAPARLDVEVDIGRAVALGGEEPLEQQPEPHGVGPGDAQGEADGRVGRRAPTLAVDVVAPAELHDVPDDQEVAGEPEGPDHLEFVVDLGPRSRYPLVAAWPVAGGRPPPGQLDQPGLLVVTGGDGEVGEPGRHQPQVEGTGLSELARPLHGPGPATEAPLLLAGAPQVGGGRRRQPSLELGQGSTGPHRGQGGGQGTARGGGVVDVVGGYEIHPPVDGQEGEGVVAGGIEGVPVVPQLHGHVLPPEGPGQPVELAPGGGGAVARESGGDRSLAAAGEHQPVPPVPLRQVVERAYGLALRAPGQMGLGDGPAQPRVAVGVAGQDHQMGPGRVGFARPRRTGLGARAQQGELGAEDAGEPHGPGRLGEADHPVQPVVVGQGEGAQPEPGGLGHELLGVRGTVEEAEIGMAVQLGIAPGILSRRSPPATSRPARA